MKTKHLWAGIFLAGSIFTSNSQSIVETANLTSGGLNAGVSGGAGSTYYGYYAGSISTGASTSNTFIGTEAGKRNTTGSGNTFVGHLAGVNNTIGVWNVAVGFTNGATTTGSYNVFLGNTNTINSTGSDNVFIGAHVGTASSSGSGNIFIGKYAGSSNNGSHNVEIGHSAGGGNTGSNNVFIGKYAGNGSSGSDLLFIDNTTTPTPLIWGSFANDQLKFNGKVGIGMGSTAFPSNAGGVSVSNYKLIVNGGVLAKEVRVSTSWADYVFEDGYKLRSLEEVESFIKENGHLPNVPSANQVAEEGIEVGDMARIQQEKIEELTLYIIAQNKALETEKLKNEEQDKEIRDLKILVDQLLQK